ncbi:nucleoside-diphosphate sugar epimerase [Lysobacter sp. TY2-98]|uniref:mitochondrial fission ELM1 family protein n=1 Tax=Lysobacter sp. TY2-98 TaxID=2290922 RepID=UPI000E207260|nr:mitochondrial fission ELM1 family protein [Lysobacter sp. TY2-98]AXK72658.1 nucleoside-diphosphate sugar epimerase [Lysobacter sp. TY2-98]
MQRSTPTRILVVTDGHAGNVRQARALADALKLPTTDLVLTPRLPWRWFAPRIVGNAARAFGPEFERLLRDPALASTLAIGCGRQGALATRLLRQHGAHAVQILDPRIRTTHWDAVIAPAHDRLRGPNVIELQGSLNPVQDHWLGASRAAFASFGALPGPRTALLIGGPTSNMRLSVRGFDRWLRDVRTLVEREGGSILATTSRRTPPKMVERVRKRLRGMPGIVWTGSVDGRNPYAALLGWADRIICTADSVNMLSEACATRAPVYVAGDRSVRGRPRRFIEALRRAGRIRPLTKELEAFEAEPMRETQRVAAVLRERFGLPAPTR